MNQPDLLYVSICHKYLEYFDSLSQCIHIKADKTVDEVFKEISMKLDEML